MHVEAFGGSRQARPSQRGPRRDQHRAYPDQHGGEGPQEHVPPAAEQQHETEDGVWEEGGEKVEGAGPC